MPAAHPGPRLPGLAAVLLATASAGAQTATVGQPAPAFELVDVKGKVVKLSDVKGKHVVLEWTNPGCPFVLKHYGSQNMQALQQDAKAKDVVWLGISSTAPGHGDYLAPGALAAQYQAWGATPTALLMDVSGKVGRSYGARTTPHMWVIDPTGKVIYTGGIDDKPTFRPADVKDAKNYVAAALDESMAGKAVTTPVATPYGCSVKYKN